MCNDLTISLNAITQGLPKLEFLDISWNYLTSYYDDLGPLQKHCPALESLDTRHNPWNKVFWNHLMCQLIWMCLLIQMENLRCYAVGRIRTLHTMDGQVVSQEEASEAIRNVLSSHLSLATLLEHARVEVTPLPSLSVVPIAQALAQQRPCSPQPTTPGTDWCKKVAAQLAPTKRLGPDLWVYGF